MILGTVYQRGSGSSAITRESKMVKKLKLNVLIQGKKKIALAIIPDFNLINNINHFL